MSARPDVLTMLETIRCRARTIDLPAIDAAAAEIRMLRDRFAEKLEFDRANPMGGVARLFEACASRIRNGEPTAAVMSDMGIAFVTSEKSERDQLRARIAAMEDDGK